MNDSLPCLDLLEATPAILRGLMSEISEEDSRWKPAEDRFSIAEVLSHLSHSEGLRRMSEPYGKPPEGSMLAAPSKLRLTCCS